MAPRTQWKGVGDLGRREYTPEEYRAVVGVLKELHVGPTNKVRQEALAKDPAIASLTDGDKLGRMLRAIIADADGVEFVVHTGDDGIFVCTNYEQTNAGTRRLLATANSLQNRADRRNAYARKWLPRVKPTLPGLEDAD